MSVFVALGNLHAMRMRHIILLSVAFPAQQHLSKYLTNGMFSKKVS